jgi:hypothetical protein
MELAFTGKPLWYFCAKSTKSLSHCITNPYCDINLGTNLRASQWEIDDYAV